MSASVEILKAARAKIASPKNWILGAYARTDDGVLVRADSSEAYCFCIMGSIMACGGHRYGEEVYTLKKLARKRGYHDVASANDVGGHRLALELLDEAIALTEASNA